MISINRLLAGLVIFVIAAAAGRFWTTANYYRHTGKALGVHGLDHGLRQRLFLGEGHEITRLIAVADSNLDGDVPWASSWRVAWFTADQGGVQGDDQPRHLVIRGVAIIRDRDGDLKSIDISSLLGQSLPSATEFMTHQWLSSLTNTDIQSLPSQNLRHRRLDLATWEKNAPVYVTAGPDGAPGVAGQDDDGNGLIDDMGELGATGSDDFVVAPGQPGYQAASTGQTLARLISHGAVVDVPAGQPITISESGEIWLDFDRNEASCRQIMLRLR